MAAFLVGLLALALLGLGPLLAIVALVQLSRLRGLRERVAALELTVEHLERRLRQSLRAEAPARPEPLAPQPQATPPRPPVVPPRPAPPPPARPPAPVPAAPAADAPAPAAARPSPPPPPPPSAPASAPKIDWERWLGVRGAAALGGIVLALAALLFFQYSIQHGLITPPMRVALGIVVGLGCIVASEFLHPRGYDHAASALAGAGVVALYAAIWAAQALYTLIGLGLCFFLMALVTVVCGLLAVRRSSQLVAVLGLLGGFATPLLLRSTTDRPVGLFGYVLLLDLGLLAIGQRKRWPSLGLLSLLGTALLQGLWFGARLRPGLLLLGLAILAVFAALYAAAGYVASPERRREWQLSQAAGVLLPFAFALYFASRVDLGPHLFPIALLLALLSAGACVVGRASAAPWLAAGAALGGVAVCGVWMAGRPLTTPLAWELAGVAVGLAALFHVFVERERDAPIRDGPALAALLACGGQAFVLFGGAARSTFVAPWPWLAGWLALAALAWRHATFPGRSALALAAAAGLALGASEVHVLHGTSPAFPPAAQFGAMLVALAVGLQLAARLKPERGRRVADHAAALLPVGLVVGLAPSPLLRTAGVPLLLVLVLMLLVLAVLAATRLRLGGWLAGVAAATLLVHGILLTRPGLRDSPADSATAFVFFALTVVLLTLWPLAARRAFLEERVAWTTAALAGPAWFLPLLHLFKARFGSGYVGALPIALGALSLATLAGVRRLWPAQAPLRQSAIVWFAAVAISFVSVAIPLQLDREWITIGWALEGLGLIALWRRLDHPGLKWLALGALAAATVRLVANPALLGYYPRSGTPVLNWILYTYLVPAAALLGSARLLRPLEVERARAWELPCYRGGWAVGSALCGLGAIAVGFVWINLAIADLFGEGPALTLRFGRTPARDLTVSIAWALYALGLLILGMLRDLTALRWVSLATLLLTIGKVFLYDLGELRDLYRVASLVGLAVSLILVSLLYQRFVFRRKPVVGESS